MSAAEFQIRVARPDDALAIATLHVMAWRQTYAPLAPAEAVRILDVAYRHPRWVEMLAKAGRTVLVAESAGRIVGIGTAGAPTVPELKAHGEILYLYVDPAAGRRGIGRALMHRLALALQADGYQSAALGVVDGNSAALDFYRKLGGRMAGYYTDAGPVWRSRNQIVIWDDLKTLLERTSPAG